MIKVYYLNWDDMNKTHPDIDNYLITGYVEGTVFNPSLYRMHEYELESNTVEGIFAELNDDLRPNKQTERSMCVGDVVELNGKLYGINICGHIELQKGV